MSELKVIYVLQSDFVFWIQSFEGMVVQRNRSILPLLAHVVASNSLEQFLITFVGRTVSPQTRSQV